MKIRGLGVAIAGGLMLLGTGGMAQSASFELAGVTITPHVRAESMRFYRESGKATGALVRLFVRAKGAALSRAQFRFEGDPAPLQVQRKRWAWCDLPDTESNHPQPLPADGLTVLTFNTFSPEWSLGKTFPLSLAGETAKTSVTLTAPQIWLSAVTFLASKRDDPQPDTLLFHLVNRSSQAVKVMGARLYLPRDPQQWTHLFPQPPLKGLQPLPKGGSIPAGESGCVRVATGTLPLTYAALEVTVCTAENKPTSLWAHVRIRREAFDISGGWVGGAGREGRNTLTFEPFLQTLKRFHVNTGHIGPVPGYTDQTGPNGLYTRYPIKHFWELTPLEQFNTEAMLPRVHAAEYLGEPQYNNNKPMPPQEVWQKLQRYAPTRLPSTVTLSDESTWRFYAGLSDYPHYDAYRVTAPSADAWRRYDRWNGKRIGWGAPLETIGDMCRSLREMSRPASTAYWSQGPHEGWDVYDKRQRTSPTPDELRLQAYHALSSRITSLYWFNLSLKSLVQFRDTLEPMTRIGREIRMLEAFYLEGDAYRYEPLRRDGKPDWDLASIVSPQGALLFALDLDYTPDPQERVFTFGSPRAARFRFALPTYLRNPTAVFRVDSEGTYEVAFTPTPTGVEIQDRQSRVALYVATPNKKLRAQLETRRQQLIAEEKALGFDPAHHDADFATLQSLLPASR